MPLSVKRPTVRIEMIWNDAGKYWVLKLMERRQYSDGWSIKTVRIDQSAEIDHLNALRLADSIKREMESWLPY